MSQFSIPREKVFKLLDLYSGYKVITAVAPGGYGKSITLKFWLDRKGYIFSWLDLQKRDNDINIFLFGVLNGLEKYRIKKNLRTFELLQNTNKLDYNLIINALLEDLDQVKEDLFLVFDNYQFINNPMINKLLNDIIYYSKEELKIIFLSRKQLPLDLVKLKINHKLVELSSSQLKFNQLEFKGLLNKFHIEPLSDNDLSSIIQLTEGWVIALRVVCQKLLNKQSAPEVIKYLDNNSIKYFDFFMADIFNQQQPAIKKYLVLSSLLNNFSSGLINFCISRDKRRAHQDFFRAKGFINYLLDNGLFIVTIDNSEFFRYHHLFKDFLIRQQHNVLNTEDIQDFISDAAYYLSKKDSIEEAIEYALSFNDEQLALDLFIRYKNDIINKEKFRRLNYILNLFPEAIVATSIPLLIVRAILADCRANYTDMHYDLNAAKLLMENTNNFDEIGSYYSLSACKSFLTGQIGPALEFAEKAIKVFNNTHGYLKDFAVAYKTMSLFALGELDNCFVFIEEQLQKTTSYSEVSRIRALSIKNTVLAMNSDLVGLKETSIAHIKKSKDNGLLMSWTMASYFLGMSYYQSNDLIKAKQALMPIINSGFYGRPIWNFNIYFIYLNTLLHLNEKDNFDVCINDLENLVDSFNVPIYNTLLDALKSEFALLCNNHIEAKRYAGGTNFSDLPIAFFAWFPQLNRIKIQLQSSKELDIEEAGKSLSDLIEVAKSRSNKLLLMQSLALHSIYFAKINAIQKSINALCNSINLNTSGINLRLYLDLGLLIEPSFSFLKEFSEQNSIVRAVAECYWQNLSAIKNNQKNNLGVFKPLKMGTSITKRELEIIGLVSKGFTNMQIANMLFISVETVKKHLSSVFKKLHVRNRIGAVIQAGKLNLLKS